MFINKRIFIVLILTFVSFGIFGEEFLYLLDPLNFKDFYYPMYSDKDINRISSSVYFYRWDNYEEYIYLGGKYKFLSFDLFSHQINAPYIDENGDSLGEYTLGQYLISMGISSYTDSDMYGLNIKFAYERIDTFTEILPLFDVYLQTKIKNVIWGLNIVNASFVESDYPPIKGSLYCIFNVRKLYFSENISYSYYRGLSSLSSLIFKPYSFVGVGLGGYFNSIIKRFNVFISFDFLNMSTTVGYVVEEGESLYKRDITGISVTYKFK